VNLYKKFFDRVKYQGLLSALNYFLITVGLEKLGFEIIKQFIFTGPIVKTMDSQDINVFSKKADIQELLLNDLTKECGPRFSVSVDTKLNKKNQLAIGVIDGRAASIAWLMKPDNAIQQVDGYDLWLIQGCLTLAKYRGMGLYPKSITRLVELTFSLAKPNIRTAVLIESSIANYASIKGIIQCGFKEFGYVIHYKDKVLFSSKRKNY